MLSIGMLSKQTGVKVPTIRYYEQMGLLTEPVRTSGNQRRYTKESRDRLSFIKHARDLGFPIEEIASLIELSNHPDQSYTKANEIAQQQLSDVRHKITRLQRLEKELRRITDGCSGDGKSADCYVLASLGDHGHCLAEH